MNELNAIGKKRAFCLTLTGLGAFFDGRVDVPGACDHAESFLVDDPGPQAAGNHIKSPGHDRCALLQAGFLRSPLAYLADNLLAMG